MRKKNKISPEEYLGYVFEASMMDCDPRIIVEIIQTILKEYEKDAKVQR